MSHIVTVQTKLHDPVAIRAACQRLGLAQPTEGTVELFSGNATGLIVKLPDWEYPLVVDVLSGEIRYDDYGGRWGNVAQLDQFMQAYAAEKVTLEAKKRGHTVTEQTLEDGSLRIQIVERA